MLYKNWNTKEQYGRWEHKGRSADPKNSVKKNIVKKQMEEHKYWNFTDNRISGSFSRAEISGRRTVTQRVNAAGKSTNIGQIGYKLVKIMTSNKKVIYFRV